MENRSWWGGWVDQQMIIRLRCALVVAFIGNIILLSAGVFLFYWRAPQITWVFSPMEQKEYSHTLETVLEGFEGLSWQGLVDRLQHREVISDSWRVRDLALGLLVSVYEWDIESSLGKIPPPMMVQKLSTKKGEITLFPGMSDDAFEEISSYIQREPWPFTPLGLFRFLQKNSASYDSLPESLKEAFYRTREFSLVELLFQRNPAPPPRGDLLAMLLESDFDTLERFTATMKMRMDLTMRERERFLVTYAAQGSKTAQEILQGGSLKGVIHSGEVSKKPAKPRRVYVVQSGDSLWKIVRKYQTTIQELKKKNRLNTDLLQPGQELILDL